MMIQLQLTMLCLAVLAYSLPREAPDLTLRVKPRLRDSEEVIKPKRTEKLKEDIAGTSHQREETVWSSEEDIEIDLSDFAPTRTEREKEQEQDETLFSSRKGLEKFDTEESQNEEDSSEDKKKKTIKPEADCNHEGLQFLKDFFKLPRHFYNFYVGR